MTLELSGRDDLADFYEKHPESNLFVGVKPAFGGEPRPIVAAKPAPTKHPRLHLLAGHLELASFEPELAMAHKLLGAMPVLKNLPGAIGHLIRITAESIGAQYALLDMSPSIGAINQNVWLQSDYFLVPTSPDFFCLMAVDSLSKVLPSWHQVGEAIRSQQKSLTYKLPKQSPIFVGMLSQRYRPRSGRPAAAFQRWIDMIVDRVEGSLVPALTACGMSISKEAFFKVVPEGKPFELAQVRDFNSLIARSQQYAKPVFALSDLELSSVGTVAENLRETRDEFRTLFDNLGKALEDLCLPRR